MRKTATMAVMAVLPIILASVSLPATGPLPESKPRTIEAQTKSEEKTPVPETKPDAADTEIVPSTDAGNAQSPEKMGPHVPTDTKPKSPAQETLEEQKLTIAPETAENHAACLEELQAMGADFKEIPRIDDGNGCGIDKPITLTQALPGIIFKPEGTMRCQAALALAHWMKESVIPSASAALPDEGTITTINQASTYICRLRNSAETGKISEHARGNAIDVASFTFKSGKTVAVEPRREDSTLAGAFQRAASATGCLYFSTVLDPESDAAHEHHFHLDVMERKGGYRYCH